jgi:hypothetical protein
VQDVKRPLDRLHRSLGTGESRETQEGQLALWTNWCFRPIAGIKTARPHDFNAAVLAGRRKQPFI